MGRLRYDSTLEPILIDDVTLAHLKIVIGTKLRRHESFMMTWIPDGDSADRRLVAWIHPSIPLALAFDTAEPITVDADRIARMMHSLNAHGELVLESLA